MRVVIIGGTGMIGRTLSEELRNHGHVVTILSRSGGHSLKAGEVFQQWDGVDAEKLAQLLVGQEAVVNLAGQSLGADRWTKQRKDLILSSRLEPGQALAQAVASLKEKPLVVIQASAVGYYGTGSEAVDEKSPMGEDWLASVCEKWEKVVAGIAASGTRLVIIRSGVVLSREGGVLAQLTLPMRMLLGGPLGSGQQWISWIHIRDEVRAIRYLIERQECQGVYNLVAPDPVTNRLLEKMLAGVMHRPYWLPVPAFALKLILGEMSTLVLDGQKVLPVRLLQADFKFEFPGPEPTLRDLLN